jgi:hypothetical protein
MDTILAISTFRPSIRRPVAGEGDPLPDFRVAFEELAQNGVRREAVPDRYVGAAPFALLRIF